MLSGFFRCIAEPASPEAIQAIESWLQRDLPSGYVALLLETNGAEWGIHDEGGDCLCIWPPDIVREYNEGYSVQRWLPGTVAIGSDGGDDAILLDCSGSADPELWPVIRVGFGALDREEFELQGASFAEWASNEFRLRRDPPPQFELPTRAEVAEDVEAILKDFPDGDEPF